MIAAVLLILFANIIWSVLNWKAEWDHVVAVWSGRPLLDHPPLLYLTSLLRLVGDIVITSMAASVFGFSGFYGAAGALFMSNMLSVVFFLPRRQGASAVQA